MMKENFHHIVSALIIIFDAYLIIDKDSILYVFGGLKGNWETTIQSIERLYLNDLQNKWELIKLDTKQGEWL